jgi:cell division protein FtsN
MKILTYLFVGTILLMTSCAGTSKSLRSSNEEPVKKTLLMPSGPIGKAGTIKEVEEKLVPVDEKAPDPHRYFVIIGSFKDPVNAKEHQAIVLNDGFKSEILKNDAGLYRVSVMATDDIMAARTEVRRIWAKYTGYSDTWMLISVQK